MSVDAVSLIDSLGRRLHDLGLAHYLGAAVPIPAGIVVPAVALMGLPKSHISAISITPYYEESDPNTWSSTPMHAVQLLFREPGADPRPVLNRERAVRRALCSMLPGVWPGGVAPLSVSFSSAAPADRDDDGCWTRSADYYIRLNPGD